ncbi:hypothetical protein [Caulobacter hibisci]|uniref:DUF4199 domain-containing protein n=1 Tax=Caulobacter hibisci TaxID=2035993 RepID=A0ABS0T3T9_9CAUL|nr:hypothetical protein [Caulobacter hibisci]MBI1686161.1 hypothetical protein [Caulobacter hibisci]
MKLTDYLSSFKSIWAAAAIAAGAGPLGLWAADLEPPWPTSAGKVATLFCAVAILTTFFANASTDRPDRRRRGLAGVALLVLGSCGVAGYLWLYSQFVVQDSIELGGRSEVVRAIVGSELRPELRAEAEHVTNLDLLRDALYDPEQVWTPRSVNQMRLSLLAAFVLGFVAMTLGAGLLAHHPSAKSGSRAKAGAPNPGPASPE